MLRCSIKRVQLLQKLDQKLNTAVSVSSIAALSNRFLLAWSKIAYSRTPMLKSPSQLSHYIKLVCFCQRCRSLNYVPIVAPTRYYCMKCQYPCICTSRVQQVQVHLACLRNGHVPSRVRCCVMFMKKKRCARLLGSCHTGSCEFGSSFVTVSIVYGRRTGKRETSRSYAHRQTRPGILEPHGETYLHSL